QGISPSKENIKPLLQIESVKDRKALSRFVNFASFYRQFVKDFASIAFPLRELLISEGQWNWTPDCENAFQTLKAALASPPVLVHFDPTRKTIVKSDASQTGFG